LVPVEVELVESHELAPRLVAWPPGAADVISSARRMRQVEFATGRSCAREALRRLGMTVGAIPVGTAREPVWPDGVVGSITHCPQYCAAAVAPRPQLDALGIDAERNRPLPDGVAERTCLPSELAGLSAEPGVSWPAVLFSARESIFKAWYPIARRWLDYHDVLVTVDLARREFTAKPLRLDLGRDACTLARLQGRFAWSAAHVFTAAWLHA
jgi:enterobactin synthetase component D / holo-[acyl-carrier protein] synthase